MYIGIDLGGTNIAAGLVTADGKIIAKDSVPTLPQRGWKYVVNDMADLTKRITADAGYEMSDVKAIGIGSPGTIDTDNGVVVFAANIGMEKTPVAAELGKYLGIPIHMENDANAAAYGEYKVCGHDIDNFVFITLGTGVGGGIIIDRKIYRGFNSAGGEIGHTTLISGGEECTCGRRGCYEAYASVTALRSQTARKAKETPDSALNEWIAKYGGVSGRTAFECAAMGDSAAKEVRDKYIEYVAEGIVNVVNIFQPELVAIGGGISKEGDVILGPLRRHVDKYDFNKFMPKTEIQIAKLFNDAGIIGAALAAKDSI